MTTSTPWYTINNVDTLDTPALVVYPDRVQQNIDRLIDMVGDTERLRPHTKTHKSPEAAALLLNAGIEKFKCATIAEAEMLAQAGAPDVLLAYQPVGPKIVRLTQLVLQYPSTTFSCVVDSLGPARQLDAIMRRAGHCLPVYIDVNVGMNRTGITPGTEAVALAGAIRSLGGLLLMGLHVYDGHIRDADLGARTHQCNAAFETALQLKKDITVNDDDDLVIIAGGSPTFPIHARRPDVECSPGTFIYWDKGYGDTLAEQPFKPAALVITRVVSMPAPGILCTDLGHKAIASENPLNRRVFFLNGPGLEPAGHSEEHMTWKITGQYQYHIGDVLYGIPYHICPTVALYDTALAVTNNEATDQWHMAARGRTINV